MRRAIPIADRLLRHCDRNAPNGCWEWTGTRNRKGYGRMVVGGRHVTAHRVSYAELVGPITDGLWVLHKCDNPPCINPAHLFLGTNLDNRRDAARKGRIKCSAVLRAQQAPKQFCKHGHVMDEQNAVRRKDKGRACLTCERNRSIERCARLRNGRPPRVFRNRPSIPANTIEFNAPRAVAVGGH